MTPEKLTELQGLMEKATPRLWEFDGNCGGYVEQDGARIARAYAHRDAALIVAAINALPDLISLAERAQTAEAEVERLEVILEAEHANVAEQERRARFAESQLQSARSDLARLKEALEPFTKHMGWIDDGTPPVADDATVASDDYWQPIRFRDIRRARQALLSISQEEGE